MDGCTHNQRCRYTDGFYCEDCKTFFPRDSATYRSGQLLSSIWMVLHNINAERGRRSLPYFDDVTVIKGKIGIGKKHENFEELITEAELVMKNHGVTSRSATVLLSHEG